MAGRTLAWTSGTGNAITIGDGTDYVIEQLEGLSAPNVQLLEQKAPGQHGATNTDIIFDKRTISINIGYKKTITDLTRISTARRYLLQSFNPLGGEGTLIYTYSGGIKAIKGIPQAPIMPDKQFDQALRVLINIICYDPFLTDYTDTESTIEIVRPYAHFLQQIKSDIGFRFAERRDNTLTNSNIGDIMAPMIITINGPATNPKLSSTTLAKYLKINKILQIGEKIIIDTKKKLINFYDVNNVKSNGYPYVTDLQSEFFDLEIGSNTLVFTTDNMGEAATCQINWKNQFIGV